MPEFHLIQEQIVYVASVCNLNILFRHQCFQWVTQWPHVIKVLGTNLLFALESLSSLNLLPVRFSSHRPEIWSGCF